MEWVLELSQSYLQPLGGVHSKGPGIWVSTAHGCSHVPMAGTPHLLMLKYLLSKWISSDAEAQCHLWTSIMYLGISPVRPRRCESPCALSRQRSTGTFRTCFYGRETFFWNLPNSVVSVGCRAANPTPPFQDRDTHLPLLGSATNGGFRFAAGRGWVRVWVRVWVWGLVRVWVGVWVWVMTQVRKRFRV